MDKDKRIELLKEHARNERYKREPITHALISILVKKGIISELERIQIQKEFDEYMNSQVELYIDDLDRLYNPFE